MKTKWIGELIKKIPLPFFMRWLISLGIELISKISSRNKKLNSKDENECEEYEHVDVFENKNDKTMNENGSPIDGLKNLIADYTSLKVEVNGLLKTIEALKTSLKQREKKYSFNLILCAFGVFGVLFLFNYFFQPNDYKVEINTSESTLIDQITKADKGFYDSVYAKIEIDFKDKNQRICLNKEETKQFLDRIEKQKTKLTSQVVLINVVGRYTIIMSCIIGFVVVAWGFAKCKAKDNDVF
jgi:hypothetical protein